jgi:hypothetical protein
VPDNLHNIRCGLAAQLRTALDEHDGHASPYFALEPPLPILQVGTIESAERMGYGAGGGSRYVFLVEGLFAGGDIASQKALDLLVGTDAVTLAVDADRKLTSRLDENGTLTEDEDPACAQADVVEYRGGAQRSLPNGQPVLQGIWAVQVVT